MQSTVKVACLAALLLVLAIRPAVQAQQATTQQPTHVTVFTADDGSKPGFGGG